MTDYLHRPTGLDPGRTYRVDTGATNGTAATITRVDPKTTIDGSTVRADAAGAVVAFLGTAATLYLRPLDYAGNPGTAVTSTGSQFPTPAPDTGAQTGGAVQRTGETAALDWSGASSVRVPTATPGDNSTKAASTAFAKAAIDALVNAAPGALDTLAEIDAALGNDPNLAATITTALGLKAPLASPTFTGTVDASAATVKLPVNVSEPAQTVSASGSTYSLTSRTGNVISITLTANCTLTFPTATSGLTTSITLELVQDGTGSRTVTWPGAVKWAGGVAPALSTAAAAVDIFTFYTTDGATTWRGFLAGSDVR